MSIRFHGAAFFGLTAFGLTAASLPSQTDLTRPGQQPVELGAISWHRDFDAACAAAEKARKPILLLFQEVPG